MVMSGRSANLTTLFLGRLRPKRWTSNSCTYFRQKLTTVLLEQRKEKRKYMAGPGIEPGTSGSWVRRATDCATPAGHLLKGKRVSQHSSTDSHHNGYPETTNAWLLRFFWQLLLTWKTRVSTASAPYFCTSCDNSNLLEIQECRLH